MAIHYENAGQMTVEQLQALLKVYRRVPLVVTGNPDAVRMVENTTQGDSITFGQFLEQVHHNHLMGCLTVPWCGMWLGIERDGYTHS